MQPAEPLSSDPWLGDADLKSALERRPIDVEQARAAAVTVWRRATASPGGPELSPNEEAAAGEWLRRLGATPGLEVLAFGLGGERPSRFSFGFFANLSQKISWLSQRGCAVCPVAPPDAPWFNTPIRLRPESRQSVTGAYLESVRQRVAAVRGETYVALRERDLCVQLTFVLAASRSRVIDVDNLAKSMCDALRGTVYRDDNQIQHLDVMKIRIVEDAEERAHLSVRPTAVSGHRDVFDRRTHHSFGVVPI